MVESLLDDLLPRGDLKSDLISTKNDESRPNVNSERTADFISTKSDESRSNVNSERADSKSDLIPTSNDEIRQTQRASINEESSAKTKTKLEEKRVMKSEHNGIYEKEVKMTGVQLIKFHLTFSLDRIFRSNA
jgi:hypothetical protein